jgi:hypothetical protein
MIKIVCLADMIIAPAIFTRATTGYSNFVNQTIHNYKITILCKAIQNSN